MEIKADGIIFDFNGTLFWDEDENREAWDKAAVMIRGKALSDSEFSSLNGRTDEETILYFLPDADIRTIDYWSNEKEKIYKEICLKGNPDLSPGSRELLRMLRDKGVPMAIASSAPKVNMDWYIPRFHLLDYFPQDAIIAGRTDIPSKPDGTIFRLALNALGIQGEHAIAFEDSKAGVMSALDAGIAHVYRFRNPGAMPLDMPNVMEIGSFSELGEYD